MQTRTHAHTPLLTGTGISSRAIKTELGQRPRSTTLPQQQLKPSQLNSGVQRRSDVQVCGYHVWLGMIGGPYIIYKLYP